MSRKCDISTAWDLYQQECVKDPARTPYQIINIALKAAFDLGRAHQAEKDAGEWDSWHDEDVYAKRLAKRLRARVRKAIAGTERNRNENQ